MTARIIASEAMPKLKQVMQDTPAIWAASNDDSAHALRLGQTLCFLADSYQQALQCLPHSELGEETSQLLRGLMEQLHSRAEAGLAACKSVPGGQEVEFTSTPKYYYSELRSRRKCILPSSGQVLPGRRILSFLATEAVGRLRSQERLGLLSRRFGAAAASSPMVPVEHWECCAGLAESSALDIVAAMVATFGEVDALCELNACVKDEQHVVDELLDGSKGRIRFGGSASSTSTPSSLAAALAEQEEDEEDENEEDDEDDDNSVCSVFEKRVFVVSDCTGESAERTIRCALGQFSHCFERSCPADISVFRFATAGMMKDIATKAHERGAFIVVTLVDPVANTRLMECCEELGVTVHDLWSPLLERLEGYFDASRLGVPGRRQYADESYMKLIECIEYTRSLDDGVQPSRWAEADLMIVGPSRSGKTPLAFFMAQRGYKCANYPLVEGESLPKELFTFPQKMVVALTIAPRKLADIRTNRMKTLKMSGKTNYAKMSRVQEEVHWCSKLYKENPQWFVLDTTDAGIEENAAAILKHLDELGVVSRNTDNPSAI